MTAPSRASLSADNKARQIALHPARSFIVQAPAGSGKTELLVQRLLRLLAQAEHPGEVLAITFTKKAAGEMRERLLSAISSSNAPQPARSPERERWQLARAVVLRDAEKSWHLLDRPGQLCIETFDAFARRLTTLAPIGSDAAAAGLATLTENALNRYQQAARLALRNTDIAPAVSLLLTVSDNRLDAIIDLIAALLGKRAQWMSHLIDDSRETVALLRQMLVAAIENEMTALARLWTVSGAQAKVASLARYAADSLPDADRAEAMRAFADEGELTARHGALWHWRTLRGFLLTNDNTWRKSFNINSGFPPPGEAGLSANEKRERTTQKAATLDLVQTLAKASQGEALRRALAMVELLPDSDALASHEPVLQATLTIMRHAAIALIALERGSACTDFSGVALAASSALNEHRDDVLARLDAQIKHILVDEFQDTSPAQASLIAALTSEWSMDDGRTLFLVGDPMQSIYGFRDSDVGIFLDAWRRGVGDVHLTPLTLTANYRSRPALVDWVNQSLAPVFAQTSALAQRSVPFAQAQAIREAASTTITPVTMQAYEDADAEALAIVTEIASIQTRRPTARVAIILRAKRAANRIIARLMEQGTGFSAQEFSAWMERPLLRDLLSLTYVLAQPGDRLSWFAFLRSPLVGLRLNTLTALAEVKLSPEAAVADDSWQSALPADDRERVAQAARAIAAARSLADIAPLAAQVHRAWRECGGDLLLASTDEQHEAASFFSLLDKEAGYGLLPPRDEFEGRVSRLMQSFSVAGRAADVIPVEVLTIHKAKGLEWDVVFLPGMDRRGRADSRALLAWQFLRDAADDTPEEVRLIVAARATRHKSDGSVFDYVQARKSAERDEEAKRLLYVAVTRARERLILTGCDSAVATAGKAPSAQSLAAMLPWPVSAVASAPDTESAPGAPARFAMPASLLRAPLVPLRSDVQRPTVAEGLRVDEANEDGGDHNARAIGIVGHKLLEGIARSHAVNAAFAPKSTIVAQWLTAEGHSPQTAPAAAQALLCGTQALQSSRHLRFIFDATHTHAANEWTVMVAHGQGKAPRVLRIDRTFVAADGVRWVIDYKFSTPDDKSAEDRRQWLSAQQAQYRDQMADYANAFHLMEPQRQVRVALYFPWLDELVDVAI